MSQTLVAKHFTFTTSEVAADWHELMIPQRTMHYSLPAPANSGAASRHTIAPISHTKSSHKLLVISHPVYHHVLLAA